MDKVTFKILSLFIFSLIVFCSFGTGTASANLEFLKDNINFSISPESPEPGSQVTVIIESYFFNLNNSQISWYIDGKLAERGTGLKKMTFKTKQAGQVSRISLSIRSADGIISSSEISITPSSVDLIWQAKTTVPPFYKAKALYSHQSTVRVTAIPHIVVNGKEIDSSNLTYKWTKDGMAQGDKSGYGKNTFDFTGTIISRTVEIDVAVTTNDGFTTKKSIEIEPVMPEVLVYNNDYSYGISFQKDIKNSEEIGQEITLNSFPLFFDKDSLLSYEWKVNGTNSKKNDSEISLKAEVGSKGSSRVSINIKNEFRLLQYAEKILSLTFGKQQLDNVSF